MEKVVFEYDELMKDYCIRKNANRISGVYVLAILLLIIEMICLAFLISFNTINIMNFNLDLFIMFAACLTLNVLTLILTYRYFFFNLNTSFISNRFYELLEYDYNTDTMTYMYNTNGFFKRISDKCITYNFKLKDVEIYEDSRNNIMICGKMNKLINNNRRVADQLVIGGYFYPNLYSFIEEQQSYLV